MKIKYWPRLVISIIISQSAGLIGSVFTFSAIPTWYVFLNKPFFSPPNWLFGPVWTILYTMIGISLYRIWIKHNKKTFWSLKLFLFHLVLNALWSIIFFGAKNLGLAFAEIILMWSTIVLMIIKFQKIDKIASYLLIPYLLWVSFASVLNYSVWRLNPNNQVQNVFAQDFDFTKAHEDYVFSEDTYRNDLNDFEAKKASYSKNQTLSLKEELRISLLKYVESRNNLVKTYLTMLRIKTLESTGIETSKKEELYSKIDPEVIWYGSRKDNYSKNEILEDILNKSKEEDSRYKTDTLPIIYLTLANISLGEIQSIKISHQTIYDNLKKESDNLISLGRADSSLFDRWYKDINQELTNVTDAQKRAQILIDKIIGSDDFEKAGAYKKAVVELENTKSSLLKLNGFIMELENVISTKR